MIDKLSELKRLVIESLNFKQWDIIRIKETTSEESIYIYTSHGVVRLSKHHNKNSSDQCLCSIMVPVDHEIAKKMIELL